MKYPKNVIKNSPIELFPFPHIEIEKFLDDQIINLIEQNWPDEELMSKKNHESLKTFILDFKEINKLDNNKKNFWLKFLEEILYYTIADCTGKFLSYNKFRLDNTIDKIHLGGAMLMEVDSDNKDLDYKMNIHSHFLDDPLWLNTILIYISDEEDINGTALFRKKNYNDYKKPSDIKFNFKYHSDGLGVDDVSGQGDESWVKEKDISFKKGKLFSFIDSPISIHGVAKKNKKNILKRSRKTIRFHVCANHSSENFYGMSIIKLRELIKNNINFKKKFVEDEIYKIEKYYKSNTHFEFVEFEKQYNIEDIRILGHFKNKDKKLINLLSKIKNFIKRILN